MKKLFLLGAVLFLFLCASSQTLNTYRFIGTGSFFDTWNWANNTRPPMNYSVGWDNASVGQAIIIIEGNCLVESVSIDFAPGSRLIIKSGGMMNFSSDIFFSTNHGSPSTINLAGCVTEIQNGAQLVGSSWILSTGPMRIDGLFRTGMVFGTLATSTTDSVVVGGTFDSWSIQGAFGGPILIKSTGLLRTSPNSKFQLRGNTLTVEDGGTLENHGSIVGGGIIRMNNFSNTAILSPGNSPGVISLDGNYTAASGSVHNFEVAGSAGSQYDQLHVTGTVTLGGQLNVSLINGFTPSAAHELPIISGASVTGTFTSTSIPPAYQLVYTPTSVLLRRNSVLPVRFIYVQAMEENNHMLVRWTVGEELGVSRYEVESSTDSRSYRTLATVAASQTDRYHAIVALLGSRVFLRIRSIDQDGEIQLSQVVEFRKDKSVVPFRVYPSPAKDLVRVQFERLSAASQMRVVNTSGLIVRTIPIRRGAQTMELDLQGLPAGAYLLQLLGKETIQTCRFLKE